MSNREKAKFHFQSKADVLRAEVERLTALIESQGREHDSGCTLGSLCPWCEIERLRKDYRRLAELVDHPDLDTNLRELVDAALAGEDE